MSLPYTLDSKDMLYVGKMAAFYGLSAVVVYLAQIVTQIDFGGYTQIITPIVAVVAHAIELWLTRQEIQPSSTQVSSQN